MKAGEMAKAVANATLTEVSSVKVSMRSLREAGMLTHGAHGVNAPDMTARDIAHVLIAQIAYERPGSRSVQAVTEIGGLVHQSSEDNTGDFTLEALRGLKAPFTFVEALSALIEIYAFDGETAAYRDAETRMRDGSVLPPACTVEIGNLEGDFGACIFMGPKDDLRSGQYFFARPPQSVRAMVNLQSLPSAIASLRWINEHNIKPIAEAFAVGTE